MLVLTRKVEQSIVIGNVIITVLSIRGTKVKIGVEAPQDTAIYRDDHHMETRNGRA